MLKQTPYRLMPALTLLAIFVGFATSADTITAFTHIFVDGKMIGDRGIQIGDPSNWTTNVSGLSGSSEGGKVTIAADKDDSGNDAIHIVWDKSKQKGQFAIYGAAQDLMPLVNEGALILEMKIDLLAKGSIMMGMDCGYPCRSERDVRGQLKKYKRKQWFTFVVPVNCFTLNDAAENFDISKVNGPLLFSTEGRMEMSIADVRFGLLPVGDPGCRVE